MLVGDLVLWVFGCICSLAFIAFVGLVFVVWVWLYSSVCDDCGMVSGWCLCVDLLDVFGAGA